MKTVELVHTIFLGLINSHSDIYKQENICLTVQDGGTKPMYFSMCTCGFYGYSIDNPDISLNGCNNFTITLAKEKIQNYKYPLTYAQTFQRQELLQVKQKKKHDKWLLTAAIGSTNLNKKHLTSV